MKNAKKTVNPYLGSRTDRCFAKSGGGGVRGLAAARPRDWVRRNSLIFGAIAVLACGAPAVDLPKIAVYVTGSGVSDNETNALGARMLASLINSGRYGGFDRSASLLTAIENARQAQGGAPMDDRQICTLGKELGTDFVCIANIAPVLGDFQVAARIVATETAKIALIGESYSHMRNVVDLVRVADNVVKNMFGEKTEPWAEPRPEAAPPTNPTATVYTYESTQPSQPAQGYDALQQQGQAALQQGAGALGQAALKQGAGALGQAALQQGGAALGQAVLHEALKNKSRANGIVIRVFNLGGVISSDSVDHHGLAYVRNISPKTSIISETNYQWGPSVTGQKATLIVQHRFGDPGELAFFIEGGYEVDWLYYKYKEETLTIGSIIIVHPKREFSVFNQGVFVGVGVVFYENLSGAKCPMYLDLPKFCIGKGYVSYQIVGLRFAIPF